MVPTPARISQTLGGGLCALLVGGACLQVSLTGQQPPAPSPTGPIASHRALLDTYCVTCHNGKLKTAGLTLDAVGLDRVPEFAEVWEKVLRKVRTGAMPPPGRPAPDRGSLIAFADALEATLDRAAQEHPNPGRATVHRLSRVEYGNAIRDLLGLDVDVRALLPPDDAAYGFDNNADVLSVSPALLERYLLAARKIARLATGDMTIRPAVASYRISPLLLQSDRTSEDLPFGTRGGLAVRHYFPLDAEYVLRVSLQRGYGGTIRGMRQAQQLEVRIDGARVTTFAVGGDVRSDPNQPRLPGEALSRSIEEPLQVRFRARAGMHVVGVAFHKQSAAVAEGLRPEHYPVSSHSHYDDQTFPMGLDFVHVGGPYNATGPGETPSRRLIFTCRPARPADEDRCARQVLTALARRAYRRAVTNEDVQPLLDLYRTGRKAGDFDAGIEWALERILVSPPFLFRLEGQPSGGAATALARVSDVDLASRLSFFLWSSIPDEELLAAALGGKLHEPAMLDRQIARMLADPRASALATNFAAQWLQLRSIKAVTPDMRAFPEFDDTLREAFQQETELFIESHLREDRPVTELLTANYTFLNERLARHYGVARVYGSHFRRVTLTDERRFGLLGQGSILTVTSGATRTSPVLRGKWILDNILGMPPPPPPPNVPALEDSGGAGKPLSVREQLERHRKNPACAACHVRMDPLGFSLENFDGVGKWRTADLGVPIDASGAFPGGPAFEGPLGLRALLTEQTHREQFVTTLTEKLMTYALGRGVEYFDQPAVRKVVRDARSSDARWSALIRGIVTSTPFQFRQPETPQTSSN
jgi:hypothetical protein